LSNEEKTNDYENFEKGMIYMKILQSVRRSFPRNLAENSEAASFLDETTSFETEVQEREPWDFYVQCFHIQMVVVPFSRNNPSAVMFFQRLYFPPKHYGKNIRSAMNNTCILCPHFFD
jgi:arginine utilization protein RocB